QRIRWRRPRSISWPAARTSTRTPSASVFRRERRPACPHGPPAAVPGSGGGPLGSTGSSSTSGGPADKRGSPRSRLSGHEVELLRDSAQIDPPPHAEGVRGQDLRALGVPEFVANPLDRRGAKIVGDEAHHATVPGTFIWRPTQLLHDGREGETDSGERREALKPLDLDFHPTDFQLDFHGTPRRRRCVPLTIVSGGASAASKARGSMPN